MKKILFILLVLFTTLYAGAKFKDLRLLHYPQARPWLEHADTDGESAYNIGVLYDKIIKDKQKAIKWYKKAYKMNDEGAAGSAANNLGYIYDDLKQYKKAEQWYKIAIKKDNKNAALNLGILYKKLHQYNDAIFYYKKAYAMGNMRGANSLGYLYEHNLNNNINAEIWYKKAIKKNNIKAIGNLAKLYHKEKKNRLGAAYLISLIDNGYSKQKVITYLKTKWKLTDEEIKKAYQLQKTLDIPKHYYDPEFEAKLKPPRHHKTVKRGKVR
jgi:TPR repeat protein